MGGPRDEQTDLSLVPDGDGVGSASDHCGGGEGKKIEWFGREVQAGG